MSKAQQLRDYIMQAERNLKVLKSNGDLDRADQVAEGISEAKQELRDLERHAHGVRCFA